MPDFNREYAQGRRAGAAEFHNTAWGERLTSAAARGTVLPRRASARLVLAVLALAVLTLALPAARLARPATPLPWGDRPALSYFALTGSLATAMQVEVWLAPAQWAQVHRLAEAEQARLADLRARSAAIVNDPRLSLAEKRARIAASGYNRQVGAISAETLAALSGLLGADDSRRLIDWMANRWPAEVAAHGILAAQNNPRSFEIFATRYDSKGTYTAALPDKCVKFSNAGNSLCADYGYIPGGDYTIFVGFKDVVAVRVLEAGPWNIDDTYWAKPGDPTPRRMFADLPIGMPEAQAAFFNGYNGGLDQYGRKVTAPFGVDLAFKVGDDIGMAKSSNEWINITFSWTAGWDQGQGAQPTVGPGTPAPPASAPPAGFTPFATATPQADGAIIHEVRPNDALWSIAISYGVTINDLLRLNNLVAGSVIRPGQQIIVRPAPTVTMTATPSQTPTPTRTASPTPRPTRTVTPTATDLPTVTPTATPRFALFSNTPLDPMLILIIAVAALGIGLLVLGKALTWIARQPRSKPKGSAEDQS